MVRRRKRALDGLGQDIRDHIERETQDNIDKGMTPEEEARVQYLGQGFDRQGFRQSRQAFQQHVATGHQPDQ